VRLYAFPASPNCLKVRAVAYELGVELEVIELNVLRGAHRARELHELNPNGLVPVLVDGDLALWESNAIITYLASVHRAPVLISTEPRQRAHVDRWLHWESAHLGRAVARLAFERFVKPLTRRPTDRASEAGAAADFAAYGRVLEVSLGAAEYIASDLSVADFALACVLTTALMVGLDIEALPRTQAWLRRMMRRESVQRALAGAQQSITEMYLSRGEGVES
jgi:glutathione S-transferase